MKSLVSALLIVSLAVSATACDRSSPSDIDDDEIQDEQEDPTVARAITVMSRNLFLGADLDPIMHAGSAQDIPELVGQAWNRIRLNDFPARADAIAREIQSVQPDIIGLQEVAKFRVQTPGDFLEGNRRSATTVEYDYLMLLLDALSRRGLQYTIASVVENTDIELPAVTGAGLIDLRWTDHDVILVRSGIQIHDESSNNFAMNVSIPVAGAIPVTIRRGWNRVDITLDDQRYQIVNAHLETDETGPTIQEAQASELIGMLQNNGVPTVLVGDLNALPDAASTATYPILLNAGFEDAQTSAMARGFLPGYTCCFAGDLRAGTLFERIDYIMARGTASLDVTFVNFAITGDLEGDETVTGLKPSDHVGVFARIEFVGP
jgi:endonuclease/exonuclease/phosphatase family metal-dependent hydrolase